MRGDLSYVIRGVGLVQDLDDLGNIVVRSDGGAPVYLRDVGTLKYGNLERKGIMGEPLAGAPGGEAGGAGPQ